VVAAKHHITKFLLHRGNIYRGSETLWGGTHRAWLRTLVMNDADDQQLLEFKLMRLSTREAELRELDERIVERAQRDDTCMAVRDLEAFRGVGTLTAVNVLAEFGDPRRLANKAARDDHLGVARLIACAASITDFRPEPQTLLIVTLPTASGTPAARAAWRAGF